MRISDWSSDVCSSDLTTQAGSFCMVDPPEGRVADWPEEAFRTVRATYWGMNSEVDRQIGRLVKRLKAAGAWDSTVIAQIGRAAWRERVCQYVYTSVVP